MNITKFPCNDCKTQNIYYACEQSSCEIYKEYKRLKDVNPIYIELAQIAFDEVIQTMLEGEATHPDKPIDGWKDKPIEFHKLHAYKHSELAYTGNGKEDDTGHCLTRCAMIEYLEAERDEQMKGEHISC